MKLIIATILAMSFTSIANAAGPRIVLCEAGKWHGNSVLYQKVIPSSETDSVTLPETMYEIDYENSVATMLDGKKETNANIVHTYPDYTTISYIYSNVHYTDTLYTDGTVISQYAKMSLLYEPIGTSFHKKCRVLR